jgi:hypothetical protein
MAVREYLNVRDGRIIRAPRRRTYERRDRVVAAAIASLRERRITLQEFLRMASNYFEPIGVNMGVDEQNPPPILPVILNLLKIMFNK